MDWFDDDMSTGQEAEEWVQVGKKKNKKAKNGVKKSTFSLQKEIIQATGQESWWSDPAPSQTDEIDSLPLWGNSSKPPERVKAPAARTSRQPETSRSGELDNQPARSKPDQQVTPLGNYLSGLSITSQSKQHENFAVGRSAQGIVESRGVPHPYPAPPRVSRPAQQRVPKTDYQPYQYAQKPQQQRGNDVTAPTASPALSMSQNKYVVKVAAPPSYSPPANSRGASNAGASNAGPPSNVTKQNPTPRVIRQPVSVQQAPLPVAQQVPVPVPPNLRIWLGSYSFRLACNLCFTKKPEKDGVNAFTFYQWPGHRCLEDTLLCRLRSVSDSAPPWGMIRKRTNPNHRGQFRVCAQFGQGLGCRVNYQTCYFAHSQEEVDIWDAERNGELDREELKSYLAKCNKSAVGRPAGQNQIPHQMPASTGQSATHQNPTTHQRPNTLYKIPDDIANQVIDQITSQMSPGISHSHHLPGPAFTGQTSHQRSNTHNQNNPNSQHFPYPLRAVCRDCFEMGRQSFVANNYNYCTSERNHFWKETVYISGTSSGNWIKVMPRPDRLNPGIKAAMCNSLPNCSYQQKFGSRCNYAHSQEEAELWNYQSQHRLKSIEDVLQVRRSSPAGPQPESPQATAPSALTLESFTTDAVRNVSRWKHRDPPFVPSGNYKRCRHDIYNRCKYSQSTNNFCGFAHSDEELAEWKQRFLIAKQTRQRPDPAKITSQMLRQDHHQSQSPSGPWDVEQAGSGTAPQPKKEYPPLPPAKQKLTSSAGPVSSQTAQPVLVDPRVGLMAADVERLKVVMSVQANPLTAKYSHQWRFTVHPKDVPGLNQVCFLNGPHIQHFHLSWNKSDAGLLVSVIFGSTVPGFFQQPLFFDFSPGQCFRIFLTVFIGQELEEEEEPTNQETGQVVDDYPWNSANSTIVPYSSSRAEDPLYGRLQRDYPPPPKEDVVFEEGEGFFADCFKPYLHKLIQVEEKGCNEKISRYYGIYEMTLLSDIRELGAYTSAPAGELFGRIEVGKHLMDNSDASQIVSKMVIFVLLKFKASSKVVYQSEICKESALSSEETIYVKIDARCVAEQSLVAGSKVDVQMQFQVNRVTFCQLHYGVDHFNVPEIAFPQRDQGHRFLMVKRDELEDMNPRQESAARYIVGAGKDRIFLPGPTLIIGPYGTGKTHTVAKIVTRLLQQLAWDSKILIATHTNSAADWYITEYLHPFLRNHRSNNRSFLVRVYAHDYVDPKRVNSAILENYALSEGDMKPVARLRKPTLADISRCRVVVTTLSTSIHLVELAEVRGMFTHIFIDEAGQALEPETMIPLGLADHKTVVVLAGDHKQMGPKVHSKEGRERLFHRSMLERLNTVSRIMKYKNTCLLSFNYRMRTEILNFISKFYDGDRLQPMGKHLRHPDYYPVTFMEVKGLDQKRGSSYVNAIEAQSLVSAIQHIASTWPTQKWGKFDAKSICVLAPYTLQVKHTRALLRAKQLADVTVERVQNVQGKQFRVVFISTVRTRNTLKPGEGQDQAGEYYHGFLSEEGEIIAACTRAQSLLFVVGDPVALCSVGECQGVWRCYLQECEDNGSLLPEGTTVEGIRGEIEAMCAPTEEEGIGMSENAQQFNPYAGY